MMRPRLYASFLLWMLSELFEELPEVGDLDKPKLVFFFDEAHLLFDEAPKALLNAVEQVVRLIRSKGVGVYFVTQNPLDVPQTVLAQLGNRVQHALRAFTPRDQKAVKAAADTFRQNLSFDTVRTITELAVGEALVSVLEGKGSPSIVERTLIAPPRARVGPSAPAERGQVIQGQSEMRRKYGTLQDFESAFEKLAARKDGNPEQIKQISLYEKLRDFLDSPAGKEVQKIAIRLLGRVLGDTLFGRRGGDRRLGKSTEERSAGQERTRQRKMKTNKEFRVEMSDLINPLKGESSSKPWTRNSS